MTAGLMLLAFLAGMVAVEFLIHRPDRANREVLAASDAAEIARLDTMLASAEADADIYLRKVGEVAADKARVVVDLEQRLFDLDADLEWERLSHAVTMAELDTFRTAFRGLIRNQVNAEVIALDEPCGESNVIEVEAGRWAR